MKMQIPKALKSIRDVNFSEKTVVVRVNYNVPLDKGEILDNLKIQSSVETINYLLKFNAKVVILTHLGEPNGEEADDLTLMNVRFELGKLLSKPIKFAHVHACENSIKFMEAGEILLLENLKFHKEETSSEEEVRKDFMSKIIKLSDCYINEAFGITEDLASMSELPKKLKSYIGFHFEKELEAIKKFMMPVSPVISIIGGSDITQKLDFIDSCLDFSDKILVGGLVGIIMLAAHDLDTGNHSFDLNLIKRAKEIIAKAEKLKKEIVIPVDHLAADSKDSNEVVEINTQTIQKGFLAFDIGQLTLTVFREIIESAETILWDGPMGYFQNELFNKGTEAVGEYIALSTPKSAFRYALGESTSIAMLKLKIKPKRFSLVSIGSEMVFDIIKGKKINNLMLLEAKE